MSRIGKRISEGALAPVERDDAEVVAVIITAKGAEVFLDGIEVREWITPKLLTANVPRWRIKEILKNPGVSGVVEAEMLPLITPVRDM